VNNLEWRRSKVCELSGQGYNQSEISTILQISQATINRDITYLRQQAKTNIKKYIDELLPEEYEKCLVGLTAITRKDRLYCSSNVVNYCGARFKNELGRSRPSISRTS
jgi:DeoR/GlpR family transcriptional regulator of sugar metabolism